MSSFIKSISVCLLLLLLLTILTIFSPPTAFCVNKSEVSASGATGVLSIGPDGNIYIQFTESHAKFTVGNLIMGKISEELTLEQADQNAIQKAAYIAYDAWEKCREAKERAAKGEIPPVQMEWVCTRYNKMAAQESLIWVTAILDNNLDSEIEWVKPIYEISKLDIENAEQQEQYFIALGAVPTAEGYQPPGEAEGFTTDVLPPTFNTSDPLIIPDKFIIDSVPLRDEGPTSPIK